MTILGYPWRPPRMHSIFPVRSKLLLARLKRRQQRNGDKGGEMVRRHIPGALGWVATRVFSIWTLPCLLCLGSLLALGWLPPPMAAQPADTLVEPALDGYWMDESNGRDVRIYQSGKTVQAEYTVPKPCAAGDGSGQATTTVNFIASRDGAAIRGGGTTGSAVVTAPPEGGMTSCKYGDGPPRYVMAPIELTVESDAKRLPGRGTTLRQALDWHFVPKAEWATSFVCRPVRGIGPVHHRAIWPRDACRHPARLQCVPGRERRLVRGPVGGHSDANHRVTMPL